MAEQVRKNLATRELAWLRRGAPARTSKPKARIATATALVEGRAQAAATGRRSRLATGFQATGREGDRADGRRVLVARRHSCARPVFADIRARRPRRCRRRQRRGQVDTARSRRRAGWRRPRAGWIAAPPFTSATTTNSAATSTSSQRVREAVAGDKGEPSLADVTLMKRFWFDGDAQFAPIGTLSGGERRRLQLLLTLVPQPNVLLLDEPTNDLDLDTLRALEDFLDDWPGIVVTVSHDRAFLDRVTDELLALDGQGGMRWIRGGVAAWLTERADASRHRGRPCQRCRCRKPPARPPATTSPPQGSTRRSPSTLRRQLGQAERDLAAATSARDELETRMSATNAHWELVAKLAEQLAAAKTRVRRRWSRGLAGIGRRGRGLLGLSRSETLRRRSRAAPASRRRRAIC